jgi:hypothetical protein
MSNTTAARIAADFFAQSSSNIYHGAIYEDGLLLYLTVGEKTAQQWAKALTATEYAQSEDGLVWAFILRGVPDTQVARATVIGEVIHSDWGKRATLQDNRYLDANTIDRFLTLLTRRR